MMSSGIYAIKNIANEKMYIGQSVNMKKRKSYHFWLLRNKKHFNSKLQNSFNKHGEKNFEFIILGKFSQEQLDKKEIEFIDYYKSVSSGYNICEGGEGSLGRPLSKITKEKISKANTGRIHNEKANYRKSKTMKQLWSKPDFQEKMKKRDKGGGRNKGILKTEEEKQNLSKKLKGRKINEEHKGILRNLYKGEGSKTAKLKEKQVIEIRLRYLKGERQCDIKKDFKVSSQTIYDIVKSRRWKHIPNNIKELEKITKESFFERGDKN